MSNNGNSNNSDLAQGYTSTILQSGQKYTNRVMIGTPTTGLVRMEWVLARFGQIIPTNWSSMDCVQWLSSYTPLDYLVPDAQNLIVKAAVLKDVEWLLLIEHDNVLPPIAFMQFNEYMRKADVPVVSGLYFTKSVPPEPMVYKKLGWSFAIDWHLGDVVHTCMVPMGCTLIHGSLLKEIWKESPDYKIGNEETRRVFDTPQRIWYDPVQGGLQAEVGTSDFTFCKRLVTENIFAKAGWSKYQKQALPFRVDTNIYVKHIDNDGRQFPLEFPKEFLPNATTRTNNKSNGQR